MPKYCVNCGTKLEDGQKCMCFETAGVSAGLDGASAATTPIGGSAALAKLLNGIKDVGIFTGVLYFLSFILLLPFALNQTGNVLTVAEVILVMVLAVVVVHIFINFLYYLLVAIPFAASVLLFVSGYLLFLLAPIFGASAQITLSVALGAISAVLGALSGIDIGLNYIVEFITRWGQTLMAIGGFMFWLVTKGKEVNYFALGVFLVLLTLFGVITTGLTSFVGLFAFLFIWLIVYYKVKDSNIPDLTILFKIIATVLVLLGSYAVKIYEGSSFIFSASSVYGSPGYEQFLNIYGTVITIGLLIGIWKPTVYTNLFAPGIREKIRGLFNRLSNSYFVRMCK